MQSEYVPQNENAEKALIGAILLDEKILGMLQASGLVTGMFLSPFIRSTYEVILKLQREGRMIDLVIVSDMLVREYPDFSQADTRLDECVDKCMGTSMALSYLVSLKEVWKLRELAAIVKKADKMINSSGCTDPDELLSTIKHNLSAISVTRHEDKSKEDIAKEIIEDINDTAKTGSAGIPSKWYPIQRKLAGYRNKTTVLAARPKCGKTTFMCEECDHSADELGIPTGIISIEMTRNEIWRKIAAGRARVDTIKIDNGDATAEEIARFTNEIRNVSKLPLEVIEDGMTIERLCATMRMLASDGVKRIGIDYLQLLQPSGSTKKMNRSQEVAYWSLMIANTTKELEISTLLLSQLSRSGVQAGEKPELHHLRDSGAIEQDAAAILFISDIKGNPSFKRERRVIVDVAANRFGPQGEVEMVFLPYHQKFVTSMEHEENEVKRELEEEEAAKKEGRF